MEQVHRTWIRTLEPSLTLNVLSSWTREQFLQLQASQVNCTTRANKTTNTKMTLQVESCSSSAEGLLWGQSMSIQITREPRRPAHPPWPLPGTEGQQTPSSIYNKAQVIKGPVCRTEILGSILTVGCNPRQRQARSSQQDVQVLAARE